MGNNKTMDRLKLSPCSTSIFKLLLIVCYIFLLGSCAGTESKTGPEKTSATQLTKSGFEEEIPNDPGLSDEIMCTAAGDLAKKMGYNPPVCLYINADGKIKARPGGRMGVKNTPRGAALVMMLVNTGPNPIRVGDKILTKGEVATLEKTSSGPLISMPGIVLEPTKK